MRVLGTQLAPAVQARALAAYPYRMTHESIRRWPGIADHMRQGGYRMSIISDQEWLASTWFTVRKDGNLSARSHYCEHDHTKFRNILPLPLAPGHAISPAMGQTVLG